MVFSEFSSLGEEDGSPGPRVNDNLPLLSPLLPLPSKSEGPLNPGQDQVRRRETEPSVSSVLQ